ncbi:hypothetical protein AYO20_04748 [Fonsecaea nubica]|uniref:Uncharacterized protein n=1 Tax=Fonsecaea nubica TaxID=856822 RepID=A0A178D2X6_9EURO|nr:hypothetical protein AYO20_04748 [Fonsecaea nubica]OAL36086.1 hypothetical protein AYO20_04748 [Fonsecaea nubica]
MSEQAAISGENARNPSELLSQSANSTLSAMDPAGSSYGSALESKPPQLAEASPFEPTGLSRISKSQCVADASDTDIIMTEYSVVPPTRVPSERSAGAAASDLQPQASEMMETEDNNMTQSFTRKQDSPKHSLGQNLHRLPQVLLDEHHPRLEINSLCFDDEGIIPRIFCSFVTKYGASVNVLRRFGYMATLLFTLNFQSEAFQMSLRIVDQINRQVSVQGLSRQLLPLYVISCAQFAGSVGERLEAMSLVRQTYNWLSRCHLSGQHTGQQTTSCLEALLQVEEDNPVQRDKVTAYWFWDAALSDFQEDEEHFIWSDMLECNSIDSAFHFLHEDRDILNLMKDAITKIKKSLQAYKEEIDGVWCRHLRAFEDDLYIGRELARLVLKPRVLQDAGHLDDLVSTESAEDLDNSIIISRLLEPILSVMCVIIGKQGRREWIGGGRWSASTSNFKLSAMLMDAALSIQRAVCRGPKVEGDVVDGLITADSYEDFIGACLRELNARKMRKFPSEAMDDKDLIEMTALLAKVSNHSDLESLDKTFLPLTLCVVPPNSLFPSKLIRPATLSNPLHVEAIRAYSAETWAGPSLARSCTSSISSGYKSFKATAAAHGMVGSMQPPTIPPVPMVNWSELMSLKFHAGTGFPSIHMTSIPSVISTRDFECHSVDEDIVL